MSHYEQGFWDRLRENARAIVEKEYADLQKQTCAPELCLLDSDKDIMRQRQALLTQFNQDRKRLEQDNCRSRLLALSTVVIMQPLMLFK